MGSNPIGSTFEKIAVNFQSISPRINYKTGNITQVKKNMTRREAYVSCSRATSANGLEIIGQFIVPKEIPDNDKVKIELNRLYANMM